MRSLAFILAGLTATAASAAPPAVPYPDGYRAWEHVKSMVIEAGHPLYAAFGGMHHVYANGKAMQGYRSGHFPDGAAIVLDLFAAESADHAISAGERKLIGVMVRDRRRYAATGGWGFEAFANGDRTRRAAGDGSACFACHQAQKAHAYVFSAWHP